MSAERGVKKGYGFQVSGSRLKNTLYPALQFGGEGKGEGATHRRIFSILGWRILGTQV